MHTLIQSTLLVASIVLIGNLSVVDRVVAESVSTLARRGNEALRQGDFDTAIDQYELVLRSSQADPRVQYNKAIAHYRKGEVEAARDLFGKVVGSGDPALAARARYNMGNVDYSLATQAASQDAVTATNLLRSAISHYRGSLAANPDDSDARANIELAARLIRQLQRQQNQQQQNQQQQDQQQDQQQGDQQDQQQNDQQDQQQGDQSGDSQGDESKDSESQNDSQPEQSQSDAGNQDQQGQQQDQQQDQQTSEGTDQQQETESQSADGSGDDSQQESGQKDASEQASRDSTSAEQSEQDSSNGQRQSQSENQATQNGNQQQAASDADAQQSEAQQSEAQQSGEDPSEDSSQQPAEGELKALNEEGDGDEAAGYRSQEMQRPQTMTMQEARKMLQAVRDRDLRRRLQKLQQMRARKIPVEKDW